MGKFSLLWGGFERRDQLDLVWLLDERHDFLAIRGDEFSSN